MNLILDGSETEFVCRSIRHAALHTATREPNAEAVIIMISTLCPFGYGRPAELAAPQNQRVFKQSSCF